MRSITSLPASLAIVKLDDRHFQLTDPSAPLADLCLGVFPTLKAAESFADKLAKIRERSLRSGTQGELLGTSGPLDPSSRLTKRRVPENLRSLN
jgi:hypothetical protein